MRWTRWVALTTMIAGSAAALTLSCVRGPAKAPAPMTQAQKIARGEYLTWVTGCNDCHTPGVLHGSPDFDRKLSGSEMGWAGPWGTTYARNLTPDPETGIGRWSEDDIVKAIRTGQRADGSALMPPMPWQDFAHLTDEDAYAIAAYLKSIPPIRHQVPDRRGPGGKPTKSDLVIPEPTEWDKPSD